MSTSTELNRLTVADYVFAWLSWSLDVSFRCQFIWWFDGALPLEAVEQLHTRLSAGPLNKVVVRPRIPGLRPYWAHCASPGELVVNPKAIPVADCQKWLQEQIESGRLDIEHGPVWRLSAAPTEGGGTMLSCVWLHAVSDGLGTVNAITAALSGRDIGCLPDDEADTPKLWDDIRDAGGQLRTALTGLAQILGRSLRGKKEFKLFVSNPSDIRPPAPKEGGVFKSVTTTLEFDQDEWARTATTRGGTTNTLLIALAARLAITTGCVINTDVVPVELSTSFREPRHRDARANTLISVVVPTKIAEESCADLSETRRETKQALSELKNSGQTAMESLSQGVYFLSKSLLLKAISANSVSPCLLSNMGVLPPEFSRIGGLTASATSSRTEWLNMPERLWRKYPPNIVVLSQSSYPTLTLAVLHSNPTNPLSVADLNQFVVTQAAHFGLTPTRVR